MMEPGEAIQDRFMLKPLAIAFAAALAVGCGGGGGGGGGGGSDDPADDDTTDGGGAGGDTALTSAQKESVATTSATQVTGLARGTRTLAEQGSTIDSGDDVDGALPFSSEASALTNSMDAITHSTDNCTSGSLTTSESADADGVTVTAENCRITDEGAEDVSFDATADGTLDNSVGTNTDGDKEVTFDSDFSFTLDELLVDEQRDENGNVVIPKIGPIEGDFSTDGGYEATIGTDDSFSMTAESWDVGFGLSCSGQGFDFDFGASDLEITSTREDGVGLTADINGDIAWGIDADVWDTSVDEELTYETTESIRISDGSTEPSAGTLVVTFADGEEVTLEYESGGIRVNGTSYTYEELSDRHEDELGADLEENVLGSCGGF